MGNLDASLKHYEKALRIQPSFYHTYANMAYVFALQQKYEQSVQYLDEYVVRAPAPALKASFIAWKAVFMDLLGRDSEALHQCSQIKQVISQMEDSLAFTPPYHWTKGWILLAQNDLDNAGIEFDRYNRIHTKVEPQYPVYHVAIRDYHRAVINFHKNDHAMARSYLEEVRKNLKEVEILKMALEMNCGLLEAELLLAEREPRKAIQVYRNTPESMPPMIIGFVLPMYNIPSLRDVIPRAFLQLGELDSAIVAYKRLLHINPDDQDRRLIPPLYHYRLAKVYEQAGRVDEAESEYQRFLELWKDADADRPELIDAKERFAELSNKI